MRKVVYPKIGGVESIQIVEVEDPVPESGELCIICKAVDAKALFKHFMFWRSAFGCDFQYRPALTCGEMVEMQKAHNAALEAQGI